MKLQNAVGLGVVLVGSNLQGCEGNGVFSFFFGDKQLTPEQQAEQLKVERTAKFKGIKQQLKATKETISAMKQKELERSKRSLEARRKVFNASLTGALIFAEKILDPQNKDLKAKFVQLLRSTDNMAYMEELEKMWADQEKAKGPKVDMILSLETQLQDASGRLLKDQKPCSRDKVTELKLLEILLQDQARVTFQRAQDLVEIYFRLLMIKSLYASSGAESAAFLKRVTEATTQPSGIGLEFINNEINLLDAQHDYIATISKEVERQRAILDEEKATQKWIVLKLLEVKRAYTTAKNFFASFYTPFDKLWNEEIVHRNVIFQKEVDEAHNALHNNFADIEKAKQQLEVDTERRDKMLSEYLPLKAELAKFKPNTKEFDAALAKYQPVEDVIVPLDKSVREQEKDFLRWKPSSLYFKQWSKARSRLEFAKAKVETRTDTRLRILFENVRRQRDDADRKSVVEEAKTRVAKSRDLVQTSFLKSTVEKAQVQLTRDQDELSKLERGLEMWLFIRSPKMFEHVKTQFRREEKALQEIERSFDYWRNFYDKKAAVEQAQARVTETKARFNYYMGREEREEALAQYATNELDLQVAQREYELCPLLRDHTALEKALAELAIEEEALDKLEQEIYPVATWRDVEKAKRAVEASQDEIQKIKDREPGMFEKLWLRIRGPKQLEKAEAQLKINEMAWKDRQRALESWLDTRDSNERELAEGQMQSKEMDDIYFAKQAAVKEAEGRIKTAKANLKKTNELISPKPTWFQKYVSAVYRRKLERDVKRAEAEVALAEEPLPKLQEELREAKSNRQDAASRVYVADRLVHWIPPTVSANSQGGKSQDVWRPKAVKSTGMFKKLSALIYDKKDLEKSRAQFKIEQEVLQTIAQELDEIAWKKAKVEARVRLWTPADNSDISDTQQNFPNLRMVVPRGTIKSTAHLEQAKFNMDRDEELLRELEPEFFIAAKKKVVEDARSHASSTIAHIKKLKDVNSSTFRMLWHKARGNDVLNLKMLHSAHSEGEALVKHEMEYKNFRTFDDPKSRMALAFGMMTTHNTDARMIGEEIRVLQHRMDEFDVQKHSHHWIELQRADDIIHPAVVPQQCEMSDKDILQGLTVSDAPEMLEEEDLDGNPMWIKEMDHNFWSVWNDQLAEEQAKYVKIMRAYPKEMDRLTNFAEQLSINDILTRTEFKYLDYGKFHRDALHNFDARWFAVKVESENTVSTQKATKLAMDQRREEITAARTAEAQQIVEQFNTKVAHAELACDADKDMVPVPPVLKVHTFSDAFFPPETKALTPTKADSPAEQPKAAGFFDKFAFWKKSPAAVVTPAKGNSPTEKLKGFLGKLRFWRKG